MPLPVFYMVSGSASLLPLLLTIAAWILVFSVISWHLEYEADATAAEYVGKRDMAYALEKISGLINRPGDTLAHPSFRKRISRLLSDEE